MNDHWHNYRKKTIIQLDSRVFTHAIASMLLTPACKQDSSVPYHNFSNYLNEKFSTVHLWIDCSNCCYFQADWNSKLVIIIISKIELVVQIIHACATSSNKVIDSAWLPNRGELQISSSACITFLEDRRITNLVLSTCDESDKSGHWAFQIVESRQFFTMHAE